MRSLLGDVDTSAFPPCWKNCVKVLGRSGGRGETGVEPGACWFSGNAEVLAAFVGGLRLLNTTSNPSGIAADPDLPTGTPDIADF